MQEVQGAQQAQGKEVPEVRLGLSSPQAQGHTREEVTRCVQWQRKKAK
jgi:hypothetical protein